MAAVPLLFLSCVARDKGIVRVLADSSGGFVIFRLENEHPLQIVSEREGRFNRDIELSTGNYLIVADCSSESVVVVPGARRELSANTVRFVPPTKPTANDRFTIQCTQEDRAGLRQLINDRYELAMLADERDVLVGMRPLRVKVPRARGPGRVDYRLASIQVNPPANALVNERSADTDEPYFVSPVGGNLSVTDHQRLGARVFLMPGNYQIELNGTRAEVDLVAGEERQLPTRRFAVRGPEGLDLDRVSKVTGTPPFVDINGGHWLGVNDDYPVLPGQIDVAVNGATEPTRVSVVESAGDVTLAARSVMIRLGCAESDVLCLGSRGIFLFREGQPTSFLRGVTDAPLLFLGGSAQVAMEGAKALRVKLSDASRVTELEAGRVVVVPEPSYSPGVMSEFLRIDAAQSPLVGQSMDLSLERETTLPIFAGTFDLVHTLIVGASDGTRSRQAKRFQVRPGQETRISIPVFVSEKTLNAIREKKSNQ